MKKRKRKPPSRDVVRAGALIKACPSLSLNPKKGQIFTITLLKTYTVVDAIIHAHRLCFARPTTTERLFEEIKKLTTIRQRKR